MAKRTISTRLAIEGESAYRQSITNINRELKTLQSELKLVQSNFASNANSLDALNAKGKALTDMYQKQEEKLKTLQSALKNAQDAQSSHAAKSQDLREQIAAATAELEKMKTASGNTANEQKRLEEQIANLNKELVASEAAERSASAGVELWKQKCNEAQVNLNELDAELQKNKQYTAEAAVSVNGCASSIDNYGKEVKTATEKSEQFGKVSKDAIDALAVALATAGIAGTIKEIAEMLYQCIDASISLESAMTGVAKTTDLTQKELTHLKTRFQDLSTIIPLSASQFAQIAEVAGQLGIQGKESIETFTIVMAKLGTATNMTSEEAATMLAQFSAVTGMDVSFYENLGSVVVALGNNFATNERKIVDMAQSIAAAGKNANLTEAQMMALSAATTSVGIEAATGGTQMTKLINEMKTAVETGNDLDVWARAAGMSASEFSTLWGTNAAGALQAFVTNLDKTGVSASVMLSTLGITETRMVNMITALNNAENGTSLFSKALETANTAWQENIALTKEAETRYSTTESKLNMYKNSVNNLQVAIGDQLTPVMQNLADVGTVLNDALTELVKSNDLLVPLVSALLVAAGAFVAVSVGALAATKAITALNAVMKANTTLLAVSAITAAIAALATFIIVTNDSTQSVKELSESAQKLPQAFENADRAYSNTIASTQAASSSAETLIARLDELNATTQKSEAEQLEYNAILTKLCELVPTLTQLIDVETGAINGGTSALRASTSAWKDNAMAQAMQDKITEKYSAYYDALYEVAENQVLVAENTTNLAVLRKEEAAIIEQLTMLEQEANEQAKDAINTKGEHATATEFLTDEYYNLQLTLSENIEKQAETERGIKNLNEAIVIGTENCTDYETQIDNVTQAVVAMTDGVNGSADANTIAGESYTNLIAQMTLLQTAYETSYETAYDNITKTCGLFETLNGTATQSIQDLIASLDSQISFMNTYAENLAKAMELGVDEGLVAKLSDGSEESARILAAIVADGGKNVSQLNDKLADVEKGKEKFSSTVAEMQTNFTEKMSAIETEVDDAIKHFDQMEQAATAGENTIQGYINGLNSKMEELRSLSNTIGSMVNVGIIKQTDQRSPARIPHKLADNVMQGYINGLDDRMNDLNEKSKEIALAVPQAIKLETSAAGFAQENSSSITNTNTNKTSVNIYPQNLSNAQIDYIFNKFNTKLGGAI